MTSIKDLKRLVMKSTEFDMTVIIPIYKVEKYIERCLGAVMNQTYRKPFECILVNDCTPDGSAEIAQRLIDNYKGCGVFRLLHHECNRGQSVARNTGLNEASGKYILFVDSDDNLDVHCLEWFDQQLAIHPDATLIMGNMQNNLSDKLEISVDIPPYIDDNRLIRKLFYQNILPVSPCNKLILRSFLFENALFFKEGLLFEDLNWSYRLFRLLPSYVFIPRVTYMYVDNPQSTMHQTDKDFEVPAKSYMYIFEDAIEHIDNELYVDCSLFIAHFMLIVQDKMNKSRLSDGIRKQFTQLKRLLVKGALSKSFFLLSLYLMILFNPWSKLTRFRFFRHHHHQIVSFVRKYYGTKIIIDEKY